MTERRPLVFVAGRSRELAVGDTVSFALLSGRPTTLAGYGITDAAPIAHVGSGGEAHANASASAAGFMAAADKSKLDGIASGATANTGTVTSVAVADATGISWTGSPITTSGTFTPLLSANLQAWSGIDPASKVDISGDNMTGGLTIDGPLRVAGRAGVPTDSELFFGHSNSFIVKVGGSFIFSNEQGGWTTYLNAGGTIWTSDNFDPASREPAIASGTTSQYWRGDKTWQTLNKAAVGLGNVDNTSDVNKPISTATQNALNTKPTKTPGYLPGSDANTATESGFYALSTPSTNTPNNDWTDLLYVGGIEDRGFQIARDWNSGNFAWRSRDGTTFGAWNTIWHAGNFNPNTKANLSGAIFTGSISSSGFSMGSAAVASETDLSRHIALYGTTYGFSVTSGTLNYVSDGGASVHKFHGSVLPGADNTYDIGSASLRPRQYYGANATISTSDARLKTAPRDMTDAEVSAFSGIARLPNVWQWIARVESEGDAARLHAGPTVQAAIAVMEANGLEWSAYAAFCYDEWGEEAEVTDLETGDVVQAYRPAGDRYSFRREELLAWIVRAQAAQLDSLSARVAALESNGA